MHFSLSKPKTHEDLPAISSREAGMMDLYIKIERGRWRQGRRWIWGREMERGGDRDSRGYKI
jgi:hypothetical protein